MGERKALIDLLDACAETIQTTCDNVRYVAAQQHKYAASWGAAVSCLENARTELLALRMAYADDPEAPV